MYTLNDYTVASCATLLALPMSLYFVIEVPSGRDVVDSVLE